MSRSIGKRLLKLDIKIAELETQYEELVGKEALEGQKWFCASKALRHRIKKLERERSGFRNRFLSLPSAAMTYELESGRRAAELKTEQARLEQLIHQLAEQLSVGLTIDRNSSPRLLAKEIKYQESRVRNKQRAYNNWLAKKESILIYASNRAPSSDYGYEKPVRQEPVERMPVYISSEIMQIIEAQRSARSTAPETTANADMLRGEAPRETEPLGIRLED